MITGIVVALSEELTTLTAQKVSKGTVHFISESVLLIYSGAGSVNAAAAAELLIEKGANRLLSWGCAAALALALKPGDLVLADKLIDTDNVHYLLDVDWHRHVTDTLATKVNVKAGYLAHSEVIVSSRKDKKELHVKTGAVALDMESMAIAKVAIQYGLPILAIRVIADPANMNLPLAITHSLNEQGDVMIKKLLLFILLRPSELPGLIKLGLHFKAAKKTLASVARHLDQVTDFNCG